jgi:4-hydroxy-tetrahydrodipicolinate synthase
MAALTLKNCLIPALATPLTEAGAPHVDLLAERSRALLKAGCDGLGLFGTTGEGPHFSVKQRQTALEGVIKRGIPARRLIVSANASALADVVALARHALTQKVAGILLMPPFFLRAAAREAGVERFYDQVIAGVGDGKLRLFLYNFPDISGFALTPSLVRRLVERHGRVIAGLKDSGGDWRVTEAMIREFPDLAIMTGTEIHIHRLLAAGGAGTLCGLGNVMPALLRRLIDRPQLADRLVPAIQAMDDVLSAQPFLPSVKAVVADLTGQPEWRRVTPPLEPLAEPSRLELTRRFRELLAAVPPE